MFDALVEQCQNRGIHKIVGVYIPSKKNSMVARHYAGLGFSRAHDSPDGKDLWQYEVPQAYAAKTRHIHRTAPEQQADVTQAGFDLARRELELARDRFKNGLTDNVEVVTAQDSLQAAQDDHILSLARHEDAIMALIRAMGATEKIYQNYLGDKAALPSTTNPGDEVPRR